MCEQDVEIPRKFNSPKIVKYIEAQCVETHLKVLIYNEKLLIHHFLNSFVGLALNWYMGLNGSKK
jgi:hypothetical protein